MVQAIPRQILIHSATHSYTPHRDGWGNETFAGSNALQHVRFEPSSKLIVTKDNRQVQLAATMYYDCKNSSPQGVVFTVGDQIIQTGGKTYSVEVSDPIYDEAGLHHWELGLSG